MPTSDPGERALYFCKHILPWILIILAVIGAFIVYCHYRKKTGCFEGKRKEEEEVVVVEEEVEGAPTSNYHELII